jgi:hypothetical protein
LQEDGENISQESPYSITVFIHTFILLLTHRRRISVRDTGKVVCIFWARIPQRKGRIQQLQKQVFYTYLLYITIHTYYLTHRRRLSLKSTKEESSFGILKTWELFVHIFVLCAQAKGPPASPAGLAAFKKFYDAETFAEVLDSFKIGLSVFVVLKTFTSTSSGHFERSYIA